MTLITRHCLGCQEPFEPGKPWQVYCTVEHRKAATKTARAEAAAAMQGPPQERSCLYCSADISHKHYTARFCSRTHNNSYRVNGCKPRSCVKKPWTPEEIATMRADPYAEIPGRTAAAIERMQNTLGIRRSATAVIGDQFERNCDHCDAVFTARNRRARFCCIEHRKTWTEHNRVRKRKSRARPWSKPSSAWTDDEIALLKANPYAPIAGRTPKALSAKRVQLGLHAKNQPGKSRIRPNQRRTELPSGSVLVTASVKGDGFELLRGLTALVPAGPNREDIVSEAAILVLDRNFSLSEAIKVANKSVRSFNAPSFKCVDYNDHIQHDNLGSHV